MGVPKSASTNSAMPADFGPSVKTLCIRFVGQGLSKQAYRGGALFSRNNALGNWQSKNSCDTCNTQPFLLQPPYSEPLWGKSPNTVANAGSCTQTGHFAQNLGLTDDFTLAKERHEKQQKIMFNDSGSFYIMVWDVQSYLFLI